MPPITDRDASSGDHFDGSVPMRQILPPRTLRSVMVDIPEDLVRWLMADLFGRRPPVAVIDEPELVGPAEAWWFAGPLDYSGSGRPWGGE